MHRAFDLALRYRTYPIISIALVMHGKVTAHLSAIIQGLVTFVQSGSLDETYIPKPLEDEDADSEALPNVRTRRNMKIMVFTFQML